MLLGFCPADLGVLFCSVVLGCTYNGLHSQWCHFLLWEIFSGRFGFGKANDTINRHGIWQMLRVYGVGGKLLKVVQSLYLYSRTCVKVKNDAIEWFLVNVGLRQGCVMSPWLVNVCMDGVVREVNVKVLGKELELLSMNGGRFEINQLLFFQMIQN